MRNLFWRHAAFFLTFLRFAGITFFALAIALFLALYWPYRPLDNYFLLELKVNQYLLVFLAILVAVLVFVIVRAMFKLPVSFIVNSIERLFLAAAATFFVSFIVFVLGGFEFLRFLYYFYLVVAAFVVAGLWENWQRYVIRKKSFAYTNALWGLLLSYLFALLVFFLLFFLNDNLLTPTYHLLVPLAIAVLASVLGLLLLSDRHAKGLKVFFGLSACWVTVISLWFQSNEWFRYYFFDFYEDGVSQPHYLLLVHKLLFLMATIYMYTRLDRAWQRFALAFMGLQTWSMILYYPINAEFLLNDKILALSLIILVVFLVLYQRIATAKGISQSPSAESNVLAYHPSELQPLLWAFLIWYFHLLIAFLNQLSERGALDEFYENYVLTDGLVSSLLFVALLFALAYWVLRFGLRSSISASKNNALKRSLFAIVGVLCAAIALIFVVTYHHQEKRALAEAPEVFLDISAINARQRAFAEHLTLAYSINQQIVALIEREIAADREYFEQYGTHKEISEGLEWVFMLNDEHERRFWVEVKLVDGIVQAPVDLHLELSEELLAAAKNSEVLYLPFKIHFSNVRGYSAHPLFVKQHFNYIWQDKSLPQEALDELAESNVTPAIYAKFKVLNHGEHLLYQGLEMF